MAAIDITDIFDIAHPFDLSADPAEDNSGGSNESVSIGTGWRPGMPDDLNRGPGLSSDE